MKNSNPVTGQTLITQENTRRNVGQYLLGKQHAGGPSFLATNPPVHQVLLGFGFLSGPIGGILFRSGDLVCSCFGFFGYGKLPHSDGLQPNGDGPSFLLKAPSPTQLGQATGSRLPPPAHGRWPTPVEHRWNSPPRLAPSDRALRPRIERKLLVTRSY